MQTGQPSPYAIAISAVFILAVLILRIRRMSVKRPLKPSTLWIVPAIFIALTAVTMAQFPPHGLDWVWIALGLLLGAVLGWQRGRLMKIWVDSDSGTVMAQGSAWAIVFLVALIGIRMLLRTGLAMEADTWAISPAVINDAFVIFAVGLFGTQRVEMALRAQRLKQDHAAGGEVAQPN